MDPAAWGVAVLSALALIAPQSALREGECRKGIRKVSAMLITRHSLISLLTASIAFPAFAQMKDENTNNLRIGIIGSGSLGGTVGKLWVRAGHEVMFSSRHPDELSSMIADLGPR